jgi:hypothetical protein
MEEEGDAWGPDGNLDALVGLLLFALPLVSSHGS